MRSSYALSYTHSYQQNGSFTPTLQHCRSAEPLPYTSFRTGRNLHSPTNTIMYAATLGYRWCANTSTVLPAYYHD